MRIPHRRLEGSRAIAQTQLIIVLVLVVILGLVVLIKWSRRTSEEAPPPASAKLAPAAGKTLTGKTCAADKILPAQTYLLLTLPDPKSAVEQYRHTALCEILNDPSMKESLAHFFDGLDEFKAKMDAQYGLNLSDFLQALHGQCAFAVLPPEANDKKPDVMLIADTPTEGARLRTFVDNVLKKCIVSPPSWMPALSGSQKPTPRPPSGTRTFKGVEITIQPLSDIPFFSAQLNDTFILSSSRKAVEDAITFQTAATGSLAADELYKGLRERLGAQKVVASAFVNVEALLADQRAGLTATAAEVLDRAGIGKVKAIAYAAWTVEADGSAAPAAAQSLSKGGVKERLLIETSGPRTGLMGAASQPPSKRDLLRFVPNTALWCACFGMEPSALWGALRTLAAPNGSSVIADFEKEAGLDVQHDLCPMLGDEMVVYGGLPEFETGRATANLVFVFKSPNPMAAGQGLEKVLKGLAARWPFPTPRAAENGKAAPEGAQAPTEAAKPPAPRRAAPAQPAAETKPSPPAQRQEAAAPPVKAEAFFADVPYRSHVIRVLTPPEKSPAPNLSLALGKDYVIVARTLDLARYTLDVMDNVRPSLAADSAFTDLTRRVAPDGSGLLYFNTKASLDVIQRLARERGQELFREQTLSIDYSKLPLTEIIGKRMFGGVLVVMNEKTGIKLEAYSPAGFAGTLAMAAFENTTGLPQALDPKHAVSSALVANDLSAIGAALRQYAQEHNGAFPPGGRQAQELVTGGYVRNLRLFYQPLGNVDFSGFPENMDFQFTILNCALTDNPKTAIVWDRRKDALGGRHVLGLDGSVQWMPESQFMEQMK